MIIPIIIIYLHLTWFVCARMLQVGFAELKINYKRFATEVGDNAFDTLALIALIEEAQSKKQNQSWVSMSVLLEFKALLTHRFKKFIEEQVSRPRVGLYMNYTFFHLCIYRGVGDFRRHTQWINFQETWEPMIAVWVGCWHMSIVWGKGRSCSSAEQVVRTLLKSVEHSMTNDAIMMFWSDGNS